MPSTISKVLANRLLAAVLATSAIAGCSSSERDHRAESPENTGDVQLELQASEGVFLDSVDYLITGPDFFSKRGSLNLTHSNTLTGRIAGIPLGSGYNIALDATGRNDSATCSASKDFDIRAPGTTALDITLQCKLKQSRNGELLVNGAVNVCPIIESATASLTEIHVDSSLELAAVGRDPDSGPETLSYSWSASSGTLSDPHSATPVFTCTSAGTARLTLSLSDGDTCPDQRSFDITCSEPDVTLSLSDDVYQPGDPIEVTFTGARSSLDWVGIYFDGEVPGSVGSLYWLYVNGSQSAGALVRSDTLVFDVTSEGRTSWPPAAGSYRAFLLADDGYEILAQSAFEIAEEPEEPGEPEEPEEPARVRFGVMADTHVTENKPDEQARLAKGFALFASLGADAAVIAGDLTDFGSQPEYDVWRSIKDTYKGDGVKLVAALGNHEGNTADRFLAATGNKPNDDQIINGYHFITLSGGSGPLDPATGRGSSQGGGDYNYARNWLISRLDAAVAEDPDKPIFVIFHYPLDNTFYASVGNAGVGIYSSLFANYPQVVTFSGHIHSPNNHPRSIWQDGGFTAVNVPTLTYLWMESGMVYGNVPPDAHDFAGATYVEVEGSQVTIKNYDLLAEQYVPQTWSFDVSKPNEFPYTAAREAVAKAPVFPENASVRVSAVHDFGATLAFDQAIVEPNTVGDIVYSYRYDFINRATGNTELSFKTWSEFYRIPTPPTLTWEASGLSPGTEHEVRIYATDAYRKTSTGYLSATFTTTGEPAGPPFDPEHLSFDELNRPMAVADLIDVDFENGVLADRSPRAHTFTTTSGAPIAVDQEIGRYAATFRANAAEAYQTVWSQEEYALTGDGFAIEAVFKSNPFTASYMNPFANFQSAGFGLEVNGPKADRSNMDVQAHLGGSYKAAAFLDGNVYGTWYHVVGTYDGQALRLYVNGALKGTGPATGIVATPGTASRKWVIGGDVSSSGGVEAPFSGSVALARLYSAPLSELDVLRLSKRELRANDTKGPLTRPSEEPAATGTVGQAYNVPAFEAVDDSGVVVSTGIQVTDSTGGDVPLTPAEGQYASTFTPDLPGSYVLRYTAADKAGNVTEASFTLEIQ